MGVRISWRRKRSLVYPIQPPPKTAVLAPWFRSAGLVRVFPAGWTAGAVAFAPSAIAATLDQLDALAALKIPPLSHAVIALTRPSELRLADADRDRLWAAFRVPVFEQIIGEGGELLATECEAHEGLHIESAKLPLDKMIPDKMTIDASLCACRRTTLRLV